MTIKTILITGATAGIGKAAAIELAKKGHTIILHGRCLQKAEETQSEIINLTGNTKVEIVIADLFLIKDVAILAETVKRKHQTLDVLINNAGGIMSKVREVTTEGIEKTMAVNLFAPYLLTTLLLPLLKKSSDGRVINVSSNSHQLNAKPDFSDLQLEKNYDPLRAYGNSKLFLIWITEHFALEYKQRGFSNLKFNSLHPGAVKSNFGVDSDLGSILNFIGRMARPLFKSAVQGADTLVYLATSEEVKDSSGNYFENRKKSKVSTRYYSEKNAKYVWQYCEAITQDFISKK